MGPATAGWKAVLAFGYDEANAIQVSGISPTAVAVLTRDPQFSSSRFKMHRTLFLPAKAFRFAFDQSRLLASAVAVTPTSAFAIEHNAAAPAV